MNMKKNMRKLVKDVVAVSPVIATLMLVLVSVGSAGVFYVWQSGWQDDTTGGVEDTEVKATLQIGGSSTVYPVSVDASEAFMEEFPQYKIETKTGGSDSGIIGAGEGILDIGAASKAMSDDYKEKYPNLVETIIGYDAVVPVVSNTNPHELVSINMTTLGAIYFMNGGTGSDTKQIYQDWATALDNAGDGNGHITWNEVPKYADETTSDGNLSNLTHCTGPEAVIVTERSVGSGTEECFGDKLMDEFSGDKEFSFSNSDYSYGAIDNQGLIEYMKTNDDVLGFMAFGLAGGSADPSGNGDMDIIPFKPHGGTSYAGPNGTSLPTFGEIAKGTWTGSRPLVYLTDDEPVGLAEVFIQYVLWTKNNQQFLNDNGYVDIYDIKDN